MGETKHLLSGIRVVEAANMVYVPCVGAVMADFGAEVIKVEPPLEVATFTAMGISFQACQYPRSLTRFRWTIATRRALS
jgi:crotonobetainyl-CoA:carnitine CoA-transferase CaiB-like acyl-CoA transferase